MNKLIVHKDILLENIEKVSASFTGKEMIYVSKANAYGLGIDVVLPIVMNFTKKIAVANFDEACEVKQKFRTFDVSTLLPLCEKETIESVKMGNTLTISSVSELENLLTISQKLNRKPKIQLKINSGMNRFGFGSKIEFENAMNICFSKKITISSVFTHLSTADFNYSRQQIAKFNEIIMHKRIETHIGLNDFTIFSKGDGFSKIRCGIILLGGEENLLNTMQCFELQSDILEIRKINSNEYVGYNFGFKSKEDMKIAVVGIGYADIAIRNLSNVGKVVVNGEKCDIIGYICMDVMFVDVTNCKCKPGDRVIVIGFDSVNSIKKVARTLNTISYEVMTSISNRVKREEK